MALVLNGSGSIAGLSAGGLPDGVVTTDDLASTLDLSGKTVTLPSGTGGKVLQVVSTTKTDTTSTTSTSFVDISGLTATITPTSATSKILIIVDIGLISTSGNSRLSTAFRLTRGGTAIGVSGAVGSRPQASMRNFSLGDSNHGYGASFNFLDSPNTTSATTYACQYMLQSSSDVVYINRTANDSDGTDAYKSRAASTITVMEIAA